MMFGFFVIPFVIIAAIAFAFGWRPNFNQMNPPETHQTPLEILKTRYARGEITREEYEQARRALGG